MAKRSKVNKSSKKVIYKYKYFLLLIGSICNKCYENEPITEHKKEVIRDIDKEERLRLLLDIVRKECEIEKTKKQGIETRAGVLLTFMGGMWAFLFEKIHPQLYVYYVSSGNCLSFYGLLKIVCGIGIYLSTFFLIYQMYCLLSVSKYNNIDLNYVDDKRLKEPFVGVLGNLVAIYKKEAKEYIKKNDDRAVRYQKALYGVMVFICFLILNYFI